ncbi:MAG: hypothetical protein LQ349_008111, partial [Xanthoria aureola]
MPDIAIIGMACRVAGSNSPSELWHSLLTTTDVQRRITRFNIDGYYHPDGGSLKGLTNVDHAYMLDDDAVDKFDNAFFHVTPTEAASMDPQQRMLLEVSYEAIESAGIPLDRFTGTNTAVFTGRHKAPTDRRQGIEGSDYHTVLARDPNTTPKYIVTGTAGCMASNRLSYFYNLSGPSITVDTACSSSMAALHQAVRALQHGDSSMALVCGANLIFNVESFITMTELGFLGASGRCRSFDASGDGYGRGEGICCVLLATLDYALSIEAPIRAIIKGTRLNQDGRTQGITLPSAKAQAENMCSLYQELGIDSHSIQYLEAHGTGTPAGDPLEIQAVKQTYRRRPVVVGSVKGNVGHCEAASALVGIIKTVLCLEHLQIPAQMHFNTLNPAIDLTDNNITIPRQTLPWPNLFPSSDRAPRAAINTFGAGGTNGHASFLPVRGDNGPGWAVPWLINVVCSGQPSSNVIMSCKSSLTHRPAQYSQPLCTALQIGLVILLKSWGIQITAVVGHSSGEIGAAFAAGMLSWRNAIIVAYYRGLVLADASPIPRRAKCQGSMCAVDIDGDECDSVLKEYEGQVQLAAVNSEQSRTLSGDRDAIEAIVDLFQKRGRFCRRLKVDRAQVLPTQDEGECVMYSSVTGRMIEKNDLTPSYWAENMTSTVQYAAAINSYLDKYQDIDCILEVGPHPVLKSPTQDILCGRHKYEVPHIGTCKRDTDDFESILRSAGEMMAAGLPLRTAAINAESGASTDPSFWSESRLSRNLRNRQFPRHELLGSRYVDDIPSRACWRNQLSPNEIEWLKASNIDQIPAFSPAICVLMAIEAARQILKPSGQENPVFRLANVTFPGSLHLSASASEEREIEVQFVSKLDDDMSRMTFEIFRASLTVNDGWQLCSTGTLELASKLPEVFEHSPDHSPHHPLLDKRAQSLGPEVFDAVRNLKIGSGKISGDVPILQQTWQEYIIHPIALGYILSLGPTALVGQNLPVKNCLSSISMLDIEINLRPSDLLRFAIDTQSILSGGAISEVRVLDGGRGLLAGALQYTATEIIPPMPTASSLFFNPLSLPDITKCTGIKDMSIEYCVQLLTHKWPMSDVFLNIVAPDVRNRIMRAFNPPRPEERKRFRSMLVMDDVEELDTVDSVQYVREIDRSLQSHMIFIDKIVSIDWLHEHLRPAGFICVCDIGDTTANKLFKHFNYICEITDGDKIIGTLWRVNSIPSNMLPKKRRIVFCNGNFELNNSLQITLAPKEIQAFTSLNTSDGRFDAILIDDLEKSIITTWPGKDLIPWLQHLMEQADSLLWVTLDASSSPFVDIAGTLLRTLQAEQPSLK